VGLAELKVNARAEPVRDAPARLSVEFSKHPFEDWIDLHATDYIRLCPKAKKAAIARGLGDP
jgi:hypothetical protein